MNESGTTYRTALLAIATIALATLTVIPSARSVHAQQKPAESPPTGGVSAAPVYRPPLRGAPRGRVGGGSRGTGRESFVLSVLAPDHTGLTTSEQPSLYWFISGPSS